MERKGDIQIWSIVFWLSVWQLVSMLAGQEILLVSPAAVLKRLFTLIWHLDFWNSVWFSFRRIIGGFFMAFISGILLASLASRFVWIRKLLAPLIVTVKVTPIASFVILAFIWIPSRNLSVLISFLMCFPFIYANVLQGIQCVDVQLLEVAALFQVSIWKKIRYVYMTQVFPYVKSACAVSLGMCWKAGIAAEVIGIPEGSIGEMLYNAKIYLETADLFAWTLTIIVCSVGFESLFLLVLDWFKKWNEGGA